MSSCARFGGCPAGTSPKLCSAQPRMTSLTLRARCTPAHDYIMKPFDKDIVEAKFQEVGLISFANEASQDALMFLVEFESRVNE